MKIMNDQNQVHCDYCNAIDLKKIYKAPSTARDLSVYCCKNCGFIQSWPRLSGVYKRQTSISGEADWGYIRYGKQHRLERSLKIIEKHIDFNLTKNILDIGSNRGFFLNHLARSYGNLNLVGVEPDKVIVKETKHLSGINVFNGKIEDYDSNGQIFDFIHSSHTFEHMTSASKGFDIAHKLLKNGGFFYLELPKTETIKDEKIITEYFIDNHLFHFTKEILIGFINKYSYEIIYEDNNDPINHVYILKKNDGIIKDLKIFDENNFTRNSDMILNYSNKRSNNIKNLVHAGKKINEFISSNETIAIWGMGRLFDMFYRYADVNWKGITYFVDKALPDYISEMNDIHISRPSEALKNKKIDRLIIFSDAFKEDIEIEAMELLSGVVSINNYADLFNDK